MTQALISFASHLSRLFLQSPANPDLMYIIMFSHAQLTTTLLLVLIFASKVSWGSRSSSVDWKSELILVGTRLSEF